MADESNRTERVELRLELSEKESFHLAARLAGLPLSSWVRVGIGPSRKNFLSSHRPSPSPKHADSQMTQPRMKTRAS